MQEVHFLIAEILSKYPELNQEEEAVLISWLAEKNNQEIFDTISDKDNLKRKLQRIDQLQKDNERCWTKLNAQTNETTIERSIGWWDGWKKYAAAAAIILVLSMGGYLWFKGSNENNNVAKTDTPQVPVATDVDPGQFKAKLILADGSSVILDTTSNRKLVQQGSTNVYNKDGQLVYEKPSSIGGSQKEVEVLYNTLETSKGQTYVTVLSDGSKVWLNAESSISYPVAFTGKERKVTITGEAYFEVAKDEKRPFIVAGNKLPSGELGWAVEVLGTHFNINSYVDEDMIKTTLLEGKVKVASGKASTILIPGQQAQLKAPGQLQTINNADVEQAIAWKDGFFQFDNADLRTVMKQIARWYDVEIVYQGNISAEKYGGTIRRNSKASEVLTLLEQNQVHFKIQGKKIIVY